jgi:hypothetical protein
MAKRSGRHELLACAIVLLASSLNPARAFGQTQTSSQAGCITAVNQAIAKVATSQQRQVAGCVSDAVSGQLGSVPGAVGLCLVNPASDAAGAILKAEATEAKRCPDLPPTPPQSSGPCNGQTTCVPALTESDAVFLAASIRGLTLDLTATVCE